jgi:hypothetical protein
MNCELSNNKQCFQSTQESRVLFRTERSCMKNTDTVNNPAVSLLKTKLKEIMGCYNFATVLTKST